MSQESKWYTVYYLQESPWTIAGHYCRLKSGAWAWHLIYEDLRGPSCGTEPSRQFAHDAIISAYLRPNPYIR